MTIKEMESLTGLTRANIRYYEAEGLVCPRRRENGYRVYSQEDADTLLRVRLLRALGLPLEQIKALRSGEVSLPQALALHLDELALRKEQLVKSQAVTRLMIDQAVEFTSLDAGKFLPALEAGADTVIKADTLPRRNLPWRRYLARCLDYMLYGTVLRGILFSLSPKGILLELLTLVTMILLEPLLLHRFATTPGKAIFGIRVTDPDGQKLSYGDALERTWLVLWEGEAMHIPLLSLYFRCKSLIAADEGQQLPWEKDSELNFEDDRMWRYGLYFAAAILLILAAALPALTGG